MTGTLRALLQLVSVPRWRLAWASLLGALTVLFGVAINPTPNRTVSAPNNDAHASRHRGTLTS